MYYLSILLFAGLWLTAYFIYKRTARIESDIVYARKLQAPRYAKKGLMQAKRLMETNKKEEFYDTIFKTLQLYLGNKFHLPSGSLTFDVIQERLKSGKKDGKIIKDIKLVLDECDIVRYASAQIDEKDMPLSYHRLENIIDSMERQYR